MLFKALRGGSRIFLGGDAPLRNGVTTPINHTFLQSKVVLESLRSSQGGVRTPCTLPLDPPLALSQKKLESVS